ncbi:MAG: NAD(P)H-quinone oxidoreductase [Gemmatimonadales bacterium]|nr:MAG: NAD(P)H-quinone oxidoreductase [Gemmatimonadales bacterium]
MRAIRIREPGEPEVLEPARIELPPLLPHEVRVRVRASGLNRADLLERRGGHVPQPGTPPGIPGLEYAGVVDAVGAACTLRDVGDPVMGIVGGGGYAEALHVSERETIRVPEGMDLVEAAAIPEAFLTAWDATFRQAGLAPGETLLIHAVGSGVGTAALQLARWAGARVIGTSRTADKLEEARELGLGCAVLTGDESTDWAAEVRAGSPDGRGVDVVLDLVGGGYASRTLETLAQGARWIVVGIPSGREARLDLRGLMMRRASIRGTMLRSRPSEEKAELARSFEDTVLNGFEEGALRPVIDRVFPSEETVEAHRYMESNRNFGKILLAWS